MSSTKIPVLKIKKETENNLTRIKIVSVINKEELANQKTLISTNNRDHETQTKDNLIDIKRSYFSSPEGNLRITEVLEKLIERIKWQAIETNYAPLKRTHQFRALSIQKAVIAIKKYPYEITNYVQARDIKGVGERIAVRIDEILKTGSLKELNMEQTIFVKAVEHLTKINGIGETMAKKLISNYQILDINDLRRRLKEIKKGRSLLTKNKQQELSNMISSQIQVGLKYFEDFQKKIPYDEVREMKNYIKEQVAEICPLLKIKICGSHRRRAQMSKDIDILLVHPAIETGDDIIQSEYQYLRLVIDRLFEQGFLINTLSYGLTKFLGVANWKGTARRIDIIWTPRDSYYCALLYFTGSDILNRVMRTVALKKGYSLNNHGLYPLEEHCRWRRTGEGVDRTVNYKTNLKDEKSPKQYITGEKIVVNSEREVFEILGIQYLEPWERG